MDEYEGLGALSEGVKGFLSGYDMSRKRKLEEEKLRKQEEQEKLLSKMKERELKANFLKSGLFEDEFGNIKPTEESVYKQNLENSGLIAKSPYLLDETGRPVMKDGEFVLSPTGLMEKENKDLEREYKRAMIGRTNAQTTQTTKGETKPKAPPGYRYSQDGQSLEAIPGGPAAQKEETAKTKKEAQQQAAKQSAGIVVQDLGRSLNLLKDSSWGAGPLAGQTAKVPGTPAWQVQQMLDSVKANIGFDKLQAMRASSQTGAALGSVSDKETAMLQATAGKLDVSLPKPILEDNIRRLYNQYNDIIHGPGNGPPRYELSFDELGRPVGQGQSLGVKKGSEIEWE